MIAARAVAVAVVFVWLGMVMAISSIEAPLKFRAPGVTLQIGLGLGRLVFRALNTVEALLAEWVHHHENLAISGASGTGKSHFVEALAQAAIEADLRVSGLPCSKRRLPNSNKHPI